MRTRVILLLAAVAIFVLLPFLPWRCERGGADAPLHDGVRGSSWLHLYSDPDGDVREAAEEALETLGHVEGVLERMQDSHWRGHDLEYLGPLAFDAVPELFRIWMKGGSASRNAKHAIRGFLFCGEVPDPVLFLLPLIEALHSKSQETRADAARMLAGFGSEAVSPLLATLDDRNAEVRANAVWALGVIGVDRDGAVERLRRALKDPAEEVRVEAARALGNLGEPGETLIPVFMAGLSSRDSYVRMDAARGLGRHEGGEAVARAHLIEELRDPDDYVRQRAAEALGEIPPATDEVVDALLSVVWAEHKLDRKKAVEALSALLGTEKMVPRIVAELRHPDADRRHAAADALGVVDVRGCIWEGHESFLPDLIRALEDPDARVREKVCWSIGLMFEKASPAIPKLGTLLTDPEPRVRDRAGWALWCIGRKGIPELAMMLSSSDQEDRRTALSRLDMVTDHASAAIPALVSALRHSDRDTRWQAARVLGKIGPNAAPAVPSLIELLEDDEAASSAAEALGRIGEPARIAVPALVRVLDREDLWIRFAAAEALSLFDAPEAVPTLTELVGSEECDPSLGSARALARMAPAHPAADVEMRKALATGNFRVRRNILRALANMGGRAEPQLLFALSHGDHFVRRKAVEGLGGIGSPDSLAAVRRTLQDPDPGTRVLAAQVLAGTGASDEAVILTLEEARSRSGIHALRAATALICLRPELGWPRDLVREALSSYDMFLRLEAARGLARCGAPAETAPWLEDAVGSRPQLYSQRWSTTQEEALREAVARALGR